MEPKKTPQTHSQAQTLQTQLLTDPQQAHLPMDPADSDGPVMDESNWHGERSKSLQVNNFENGTQEWLLENYFKVWVFWEGHKIWKKIFVILLIRASCSVRARLQICAVELQWKYIEKTVILKNCSSLLLTFVRCIFYKLKIVLLTLFSCSLFCINWMLIIQVFTVFKNTTKKL